jgi:predicted GTPase
MNPRLVKWKIAVVAGLFAAPCGFLMATGAYHLWDRGWSFTAWIPMAACFLAAYFLGWYWTRSASESAETAATAEQKPPTYWTEQDRAAWTEVKTVADAAASLSTEELCHYDRLGMEAKTLALKIAQVYQPGTTDPFGHLTLPEIITCCELVAHDVGELVDTYIPGSHLLTVSDLKRARQFLDTAATWYPRLRNLYWLGAAIFDPIRTAIQAGVTQGGMSPVLSRLQRNMIGWFHRAYLHRLGHYLIELNSRRLRVGTQRYLELMRHHQVPPTEPDGSSSLPSPTVSEQLGSAEESTAGPQPMAIHTVSAQPSPSDPAPSAGHKSEAIRIAVVGPVKAGKSTLINALLGKQSAETDIVPRTSGVTQYQLRQPPLPSLLLLDTPGYGHDGQADRDLEAALEAAAEADLLLLAVPARAAARSADLNFLERLRNRFATTPKLRLPPVLLVLTQADLLSPAVECSPPYDWHTGQRPKEVSIREAVAAARELFGTEVLDVIPIAALPGRSFGVREELLPAIADNLHEGRGTSLLRLLHAEADRDRRRRVLRQVLNAGQGIWQAWKEARRK